jgi:nucleoside-diphosphate kinase
MAMERTLILLKPDAVQRALVGALISRFETKGLKLVGLKLMRMTPELADQHYEAHRAKSFFPGLKRFMTSSPIVAMVLEGRNAIAVCRKMMGATFGSNAEPGTLRGDFGISNSYNLVHGSDGPEAAQKEIALYFRPEELLEWKPAQLEWIYDAGEEL